MSILPRRRTPERMDEPGVDECELVRSLADLRGVNRWLGGTHTALGALAPLLRPLRGREVRVLDAATGSGDIPIALARWGRSHGVHVQVLATDNHPATVVAAELHVRDPDVRVERADALHLPYPDRSFDFAMCHTALHHFDAPDAVRLLRELARVAARGVVVTDLRRSVPGLLGAEALAATVWLRHPVTRHDGPTSVRGAFTPAELRDFAEEAGLRDIRVRRGPLFRMALTAKPEGSMG